MGSVTRYLYKTQLSHALKTGTGEHIQYATENYIYVAKIMATFYQYTMQPNLPKWRQIKPAKIRIKQLVLNWLRQEMTLIQTFPDDKNMMPHFDLVDVADNIRKLGQLCPNIYISAGIPDEARSLGQKCNFCEVVRISIYFDTHLLTHIVVTR